VKFDLFADGSSINTGWVSKSDGLLVLDRNHDGQINDGSELFGSGTTLANGEKATDGYTALRELDSNGDGVIDSKDAVYKDLQVWVDSNSDGVTETGELKTLASLGITSISLNTTVGTATDNGNTLGLTSSYQTADGTTHAAADVWFTVDKTTGTSASATSVDTAIAALNSTSTPAVVAPVASTNSQPSALPVLAPVAVPVPTAPAPVVASSELTAKVSSLAQAIGTYADTGVPAADAASTQLAGANSTAGTNTPASLAVVSMVDVMKQFDTNGNPLASPVTTAATTSNSLAISGLKDPATSGILATGGKA